MFIFLSLYFINIYIYIYIIYHVDIFDIKNIKNL